MEYISQIEEDLKKLAHELYKNPRIKNLELHASTMMGVSVTYTSLGDPDSPICKANKAREIQNAIQNNTRPPPSCPEIARPCPRNIPGGLQQWMGVNEG